MTSVVFVGPTLDTKDLAAAAEFIALPPVSQGDVYRAARRRPSAIGIIDGYFSGAPSVWHKEILWAMSEGVPVFGSASMGALRAAELHVFGMRGVGKIFEAFRDGALEDDDEVAVVHGPAEIGYIAASEPMVNIRETLALAEKKGVVRTESRRSLERFAKSLYFGDRNWPVLLDGAAAQGVGESELAIAYARRAKEFDRLDARGFAEMGYARLYRRQHEEAIAEYEQALALNPNDSDIIAEYADALAYVEQPQRSVELMQKAMRLNPHYPDWYLWYLADAYDTMGKSEDVIATVQRMHDPSEGQRMLAANYAHLGMMDEARAAAREVLRLHPGFSIRQWGERPPYRDKAPLERFIEGLRKAGLPE